MTTGRATGPQGRPDQSAGQSALNLGAGYRKDWLRLDLVAGLTTAAVVVPKAMAYATIAGLPVEIGLYTAFIPMVIYAFLGTSRPLSVSTTTTLAILTGTQLALVVPGGEPAALLTASATLAFLVWIMLILAAALRLGVVATFISEPVLTGFKAGIGLVIVLDQVPKLLGIHFDKGGFFQNLIALVHHLPETSLATLAVGVAMLVILVGVKRFVPRAPAPLVAVGMGIAASGLFALQGHGVETVGHIPRGLPAFTLPILGLIAQLWPGALGIALMSFTESIAAARAFAGRGEPRPAPNRELVANLKNRVDELTCIYEISQSIYFTFDIREFLDRILNAVNKVISAERCSFVILDETGKNVEYFVSTKGNGFTIDLENSLMYHVIRTGDPLLVYNVDEDAGSSGRGARPRGYGSKSFICVPMKLRDRIIGILNVTDKRRGDIFDSFDLRVLSTVANQVAETYENVLLQKKNYERERIDKELEIAAEIQRRTLSVIPDNIPGVSAGAFTIPSSYVGGDFFEFSPFSDYAFGVAVGDVSGKGIPAAIFMNSVRYALRFELLRHQEPSDLMTRLNNWVYMDSYSGMFCTFFYACVDAKNRTVAYASGGHNEQLFYRRGSDEFLTLKRSGKPLGVLENERYDAGTVEFDPGDFLVLFTDGLVEQGAEGQMDLNELMNIVRLNRDRSAREIAAHLESMVRRALPSNRVKDDSTLVLVKFL